MPKIVKELKDGAVRNLKHVGGKGHTFHAVGGVAGLILQVTAGDGRSWLMRTRIAGQRKHFGLGSYPEVSLAEARRRGADIRDAVRTGADPAETWRIGAAARDLMTKGFAQGEAWTLARDQREAVKAGAVQSQKLTFTEAMDKYLKTGRIKSLQNDKHRKQWRSTLETYAVPIIGNKPVDAITTTHIKEILEPIWNEKRETASRLRQRIESVLASDAVRECTSGENPASKPAIQQWIHEKGDAPTKGKQPALQLSDAAAWWKALRKREGMAARALEFLTLCASRSGEIRGAVWDEFEDLDGDNPMWIIPAERMKVKRKKNGQALQPHRVPLSPAAVAILKALPREQRAKSDNRPDYVFPAPRGGEMSDMTISAVMKRMHGDAVKLGGPGWVDPNMKDSAGVPRPAVPHGLRSTFRDWVGEKTDYPTSMAEFALAHSVGDETEKSYRRGTMVEKRRAMMTDWAAFLNG